MVRPEIERHPPRVVERSGWPTEVVGVVLYEVLGRLPVVPTERFSTALPSAWRRVQAALAPLGEAYVALADVLSAPIRTYDQDFRRIEGVTVLSAFGFGDRVLPVLSEDPAVHGVLEVGLDLWSSNEPLQVYCTSTHSFTGGTSTNVPPSSGTEPPSPLISAIGFVPTISAVVLAEPASVNLSGDPVGYGDTWEYSQGSWKNVTARTGSQPEVGEEIVAGAVDPVDDSLVLFGGLHVDTAANDPSTGAFSAPPVAGASASKSVVDAGQSVTQTGTVSHGLDPVLLRGSFGDGANGSASTAAHTYARSRLATADLTVTDLAGGAHRRA